MSTTPKNLILKVGKAFEWIYEKVIITFLVCVATGFKLQILCEFVNINISKYH